MKKISLFIAASILSMVSLQASVIETEPTVSTENKSTTTTSKEAVLDDVVMMDAMKEFRSLSRVEKKMRISEAKKAIKNYKAQKAAGEASTNTILLVILALILPPLAVYLHEGTINGKFWLSLLLTLLFWIPGVIYALIVVL